MLWFATWFPLRLSPSVRAGGGRDERGSGAGCSGGGTQTSARWEGERARVQREREREWREEEEERRRKMDEVAVQWFKRGDLLLSNVSVFGCIWMQSASFWVHLEVFDQYHYCNCTPGNTFKTFHLCAVSYFCCQTII